MIYNKKVKILPSGKECILQSPTEENAKELLEHLKQTSGETNNILRYQEEVTITEDEERAFLKGILESDNSIMVSAIVDGEIAGNAGLSPVGQFIKYSHRCSFGISVKKRYWGQGIGSILIDCIINSAKQAGFEQIELTVVADNEKAQNLYKKKGFEEFGKLKNFFRYKDGAHNDGVYMVKYL